MGTDNGGSGKEAENRGGGMAELSDRIQSSTF